MGRNSGGVTSSGKGVALAGPKEQQKRDILQKW